jgi:hypothetical protein
MYCFILFLEDELCYPIKVSTASRFEYVNIPVEPLLVNSTIRGKKKEKVADKRTSRVG